jgi:acetyl-CoA acyltransferase
MRDAVIIDAVRSPIGRRDGGLADVHPVDLSAQMLTAVTARAGIDADRVDDVIWGCVSQVGEQSMNVARNAVLAAGWPEEIPATTVDRQCGSSQQAVHFAAAGVLSGQYDVVVAGGVESMTRVPMFSSREGGAGPISPMLDARYRGGLVEQGVSADLIAAKWGLTREHLDAVALESHARAAAAADRGAFDAETEFISIPGEASKKSFRTDEGIRRNSSPERLAALQPVFQEDGLTTAGNSSQIADGAAALLIATSAKAAELGVLPMARLHSYAVVGVDPITMLTGPIPATHKVLDRANLDLNDIDVFEINEAFAAVLAVWLAETGADPSRVNPNGGAIALGHPLGATGARIMTTMVHYMRANDLRYGLQAICEGAGMANATIIELL